MKQQIHDEKTLSWLCVLALTMILGCSNGAEDLNEKCEQVVSKVIPCLDFATGKAPTPKKECYDAANSIKATDPECLCYIIQQTHKGSPESKSMGIQEDKLLQLPYVCNVKNASVSDCPKVLGLSPNSVDAAIFINASKINPPSPSSAVQTSTPPKPCGSNKLKPVMISEVMVMTLAFVLDAVPTGFISI